MQKDLRCSHKHIDLSWSDRRAANARALWHFPSKGGWRAFEGGTCIGIIVESAETSGIRPKLRMVSAALSLQPPILISLN